MEGKTRCTIQNYVEEEEVWYSKLKPISLLEKVRKIASGSKCLHVEIKLWSHDENERKRNKRWQEGVFLHTGSNSHIQTCL